MFYKKRNKDEYLKYNNGKIESLGEKNSVPKDYIETSYEKELKDGYSDVGDINEYKLSFQNQNKNTTPNTEEEIPKKKINLSAILIKIGIFIILIPLLIITFKTFINYRDNLNATISKNETTNKEESNNEIENKNELVNEDTNTKNTKENDIEKETVTTNNNKKSKLNSLLSQINTINVNLNKAYDSTKTDIINFKNDINGVNATRENLLARKNRLLKNKQKVEEISNEFGDLNLIDVHKNILRSYDSLYNGIDQILLDISKERSVRILNNSITDRNSYLEEQSNIIRNYLNNNNIEFTEKNGTFEIK